MLIKTELQRERGEGCRMMLGLGVKRLRTAVSRG